MSSPANTIKRKLLLSSLHLLFLAFLPLPAPAQTGAAYNLEEAEFSYGLGNFLEASVITKSILALDSDPAIDPAIKERALVIKLLSDVNLSFADKSVAPEPGVSLAAKPELSGFFKALYERGHYGEMERLVKDASGPEATYLKGLALYKNGKHVEAVEALQGVPASSRLFPYARLLLSGIMLARNDTLSAISYLDMKDAAGAEDSNAMKLYAGYLLFENNDFLTAGENFLKAEEKSEFRDKAVAGGAWSSLKRNDCENALRLMARLRPFDPSSEGSRELILAEAVESFNEIEAGYGKFGGKDALIKEKPLTLLKDASLYTDAALKSLRNAAIERDAEAVTLLLAEFDAIEKTAAAYDGKERDIDASVYAIERAIEARREELAEIRTRITKIKPLLKRLAAKSLEKTSKGYEIKKPSPKEIFEEPSIAAQWEKTLNRKLSAQERRIIGMILLDGEKGAWYLNNIKYAEPLFWMSIDKTKDVPGSTEKGPVEQIAFDVFATAWNNALPIERMMPLLEEASSLRIKEEEKALDEMRELKAKVSSGRELVEKAADEININAAEILRKRVLMMTYDIKTIKRKAALLIDDIRKESAGKRRQQ